MGRRTDAVLALRRELDDSTSRRILHGQLQNAILSQPEVGGTHMFALHDTLLYVHAYTLHILHHPPAIRANSTAKHDASVRFRDRDGLVCSFPARSPFVLGGREGLARVDDVRD